MPTPIGHIAYTPEIVAAFEQAVTDGMDVINFSGGGPQTRARNDALIEATHNVAAAGVVPVISAGNDRDDFGFGTAGSPGTAPDAITVAAVSNTHVFAPALVAFNSARHGDPPRADQAARRHPRRLGERDQQLVDIGTIVGTQRPAGRAPPVRQRRRPERLASTSCPPAR